MAKLIALMNVIAWGGFWTFGYLALAGNSANGPQMVVAILLAAAGGAAGMLCHLWLVRHSERTGMARPPKWAVKEDDAHVVH
jgi:hypothetical protein